MTTDSLECNQDCQNKCPVRIAVKAAEDALFTDPYVDQSVKDAYVSSRGILSRRLIDSISTGCEGVVEGECTRVESFNAAAAMYVEEIRPEISTIERGTDALIRFTRIGSSAIDFSISKDVEESPELAKTIIGLISSHSKLPLEELFPEDVE